MDIKTTDPQTYAEWLRSLGVPPEAVPGRIAHDMLRALAKQLDQLGTPEGFEALKTDMDRMLAEHAVEQALR